MCSLVRYSCRSLLMLGEGLVWGRQSESDIEAMAILSTISLASLHLLDTYSPYGPLAAPDPSHRDHRCLVD